MTLYHEFFDDPGLHFFRIVEPHSAEEIYEFLSELGKGDGPSSDIGLSTIIDLRSIDLMKWSSTSFRQHIGKLKSTDARLGRCPSAYVVGDTGSYGMMRMFSALSDVSAYRDDDFSFVASNLAEAAEWMAGRLGLGAKQTEALQERILRPSRR